jgi:hypothetical protein
MNFPAHTPAAVQDAVAVYAARRRLIACATALAAGAGAAGLIVLAYLMADRLAEWPGAGRVTGPAICLLVLGVTLFAIMRALLHRERPLSIAIRLDQALPENQDRWSTALEMSALRENESAAGSAELISRMLRETQDATRPKSAAGVVPARSLKFAAIIFALAASGFAAVTASSYFDLALLWNRFWHPHANLPRDSVTQIRFVTVNQHAARDGRVPDDAWRVLENEALAISVALGQRGKRSTAQPIPRLEIVGPGGRVASQDFLRAGKAWTFSRGAMTEGMSFRIRAGDALTETFRVEVLPRIRILAVRHSVRFPGYARQAEIKRELLKGDRISLLEDAQVDFEIECDQPVRALDAQFELLDKAKGEDAGQALSAREAVAAQRQASTEGKGEKKPAAPRTRTLPVKIRDHNQATLRLKIEQAGLLRLRVTGGNGLTGVERVLVIEPVKDTPPRLVVSGIEPETFIVPGETLSFQFTAEDDLGVSDVIMDWAVAGAARTGNLAGEESLATPAAGQRTVNGQRLVQRMNYHVYGGSPMEITVIAVDSKGQETRSPVFKIFLESDSFATRFGNGMTFLRSVQTQANNLAAFMQGLLNQTKIIEAAAGTSRAWPAAQAALLDKYLDQTARRSGSMQQMYIEQYHGGWPQRLLESTAMLVGLRRALDTHPDVLATGARIRDTQDLPITMAENRVLLASQARVATLWRTATESETRRFAGEALLQKTRGVRLRLGGSELRKQAPAVLAANLEFYGTEMKALVTGARSLEPAVAEKLAGETDALEAVLGEKEIAPMHERLLRFERALAALPSPPSAELMAAYAEAVQQASAEVPERVMSFAALAGLTFAQGPPPAADLVMAAAEFAQHPRTAGPAKRMLSAALADVLTLRESEAGTAPLDDLKLCRAWLADSFPVDAPIFGAPAEPVDLWLMSERLSRDWDAFLLDAELRRFALNPEQQDDVAAGLREQAFALMQRLDRGSSLAPPVADALRAALQPATAGELGGNAGRGHAVRLQAVARQLEKPGRDQLAALQPRLTEDLDLIRKRLLTLADTYDAHAAGVDQAFAEYQKHPEDAAKHPVFFRRFIVEAEELQSAPRLIEMAFRLVQFLRAAAETGSGGAPDWARAEPWQLLELMFMVNGQGGYDKVAYRYDVRYNIRDGKGYAAVGPNVRAFATQLRTQAGLLQRAVAGKPLEFDFARYLNENKLAGYPERMKVEFALAAPMIGNADGAARALALEGVRKSAFGALLQKETAARKMLVAGGQLAAPDAATAAALLPALKTLQTTMTDDSGQCAVPEVNDAVAEWETWPDARRAKPLPPAANERLAALRDAVEREINVRCAALRLPPISGVTSINRRDQTAVAKVYWMIRTAMDNFDRRWSVRMREAELGFLREVQHVAETEAGEAMRRSLALTFATLGEFRARQFGRESRANKGISFMPEDTGPSLNLPAHIAQEFFRARTARPPATFTERTEDYFQKLFQDLKR